MKNTKISLIMFLSIILITNCFGIQGKWKVLETQQLTLGSQSFDLEIKDFVFEEKQVFQLLTFRGCQQFLLQSFFNQNQVFINFDTYLTNPINSLQCSNDQLNMIGKIYNLLNLVFYFDIVIDELRFNDPFGNNLLHFKKQTEKKDLSLVGIWTLNQYGNTLTSLSVQIDEKQFAFCQGNAVYGYLVDQKNSLLTLTKIKNDGCPARQLIGFIEQTKYFRLRNKVLQIYDREVKFIIELGFNKQYDPNQPIFDENPTPPPAIKNEPQLIGKWSIQSLFSIPITATSYQIEVNNDTITLKGGCNTHSFAYQADSKTQTITTKQGISTLRFCLNDDDQLYVTGITRMFKYIIGQLDGQIIAKFFDKSGAEGYVLRPKNSPQPITSNIKPPSPQPQQKQPFSSGRYIMLLLQRRDLPRVLITVTSNTITFKKCSQIEHVYILNSQNRIKISGGPLTTTSQSSSLGSLNCSDSDDDIYYGTLNLVTTYSFNKESGTIILSNAAGEETVTLSLN